MGILIWPVQALAGRGSRKACKAVLKVPIGRRREPA